MSRFLTQVSCHHGIRRCPLQVCGASKGVLRRHHPRPRLARTLFSKTGKWESTFGTETRLELEDHWRDQIRDYDRKHQFEDAKGEKYYVLSMFPSPSGALHMGHVRVYTISDAMARFWRLKGKRVLHPMGWDAFGLPAENAAIDRGERPDDWTYNNIQTMKTQLEDLGCSFDWTRECATCDPAYYRWTQYLFLKMFEKGLAYQKEGPVNWDPVDHTVLANEQIDEEGRSWRSGVIVEQRLLKQWYLKTTAYSKSLFDGLDTVNPDFWKDVVALQKEWIGKCDGVSLEFNLVQNSSVDPSNSTPPSGKLSVFTQTPEGAYGISHILLAADHPLNRPEWRLAVQTGDGPEVQLSVEAVNPFTGRAIPIYVDPEHDFGKFLDAHLGIPSCSDSDKLFADSHRLEYSHVFDHTGGQTVVTNSDQFSGLSRQDAFNAVSKYAKTLDCGGHVTSERSRDWLISRQRYWGTPIPIIHCPKYGVVPVPYEDLPVKLPVLENFTGKGTSPLAQAKDWLHVKCPGCDCGSFGQRETDTMDTFVSSSWYFLRYLDPNNERELVGQEAAHSLMPVDLYIGGKEHAIMHLYYARFVTHFLYDLGLVPTREPFVNLLTQGMVMGRSYRLPNSGRYIPLDDVDTSGEVAVDKATGTELIVNWEKMSKSKYNGVDPQAMLTKFGTDSTRLCILANVAPKTDRNWDDKDFVGVLRWQSRMWNVIGFFRQHRSHEGESHDIIPDDDLNIWEEKLFEARNSTIKEVTWNLGQWFLLNVAVSRLQAFTSTLLKVPGHVMQTSREFERCLADLVIMIAPLAPMYASELWAGLRNLDHHLTDSYRWRDDVLDQRWPQNDVGYRINMMVKKKDKACYEVQLPVPFGCEGDVTREMALNLAKSHPMFETLQDIDPKHFSLTINPQYRVVLTFFPLRKKAKTKENLTRQEQVSGSH